MPLDPAAQAMITMLEELMPRVEHYESAALWKALRDLCREFVGEAEAGGHRVRLYRPLPGCGESGG